MTMQPIGQTLAYNNHGIQQPALQPVLTAPSAHINGEALQALDTPIGAGPYSNAALGAGVQAQVLASGANIRLLITMLSVSIVAGGEVQFLFNAIIFLDLFIPANITVFVPLPTYGITSISDNMDLNVKNPGGAAINIKVNYAAQALTMA